VGRRERPLKLAEDALGADRPLAYGDDFAALADAVLDRDFPGGHA
jgi:hypothetical protein